jgi:hypothetical protein
MNFKFSFLRRRWEKKVSSKSLFELDSFWWVSSHGQSQRSPFEWSNQSIMAVKYEWITIIMCRNDGIIDKFLKKNHQMALAVTCKLESKSSTATPPSDDIPSRFPFSIYNQIESQGRERRNEQNFRTIFLIYLFSFRLCSEEKVKFHLRILSNLRC